MLLLFRKIFLLLGWIKDYKPYDLYLLRSHHKKFYKALAYITNGQLPITYMYPLEGNKRLYLKDIGVDYNIYSKDIDVYLRYIPREANLVKYKAVNENSYISIRININSTTGAIYACSRFDYASLSETFIKFEEQFYIIMTYIAINNSNEYTDVINLDGYGDLLVLYNKIISFMDINAESDFNCIGMWGIEPIKDNTEDTKICYYTGVSQFNLVVYLSDGIGNPIILKSYHQDNKLKIKVKDCVHKFKMDLMKIHITIDDINYMLDDASRKNLNLKLQRDIETKELYVSSNDTKIITFTNEDDFNSFIDGAKDSFLRIINTGICVINYNDKKYTCFKGVLNNGIIEYIAISGDVRIQAMAMKYDPIRLRT